MLTKEDEEKFDVLHKEYVVQVAQWKREWLKKSPPMDLVIFLDDPPRHTAERQKQWDAYVIHRAKEWWKERGWTITFGEPHEGCYFTPIQQTKEACT